MNDSTSVSTPQYPILKSLAVFWLTLTGLTIVFGLIGIYLPHVVSYLALLPYFISFWIMARYFTRQFGLPQRRQRNYMAIGALLIFWGYSVIAGAIGIQLSHQWAVLAQVDWNVLSLWLGLLAFINLILWMISYWFLGTPLRILYKANQSNRL